MSDKFVNRDGGFNHGKWIRENSLEKPLIKEEFIETIDGRGDVAAGLELIEEAWLEWNRGPMTEPEHVKPAAKELIAYINKWLKKNIK
jgi:hypothetical protein